MAEKWYKTDFMASLTRLVDVFVEQGVRQNQVVRILQAANETLIEA